MLEPQDEGRARRRPHTQLATAAYVEVDLVRELEQLQQEPEWAAGQNAKTLVKHDQLRVVLTALRARVRIPEHKADGQISIQTIRGQIRVRAEGRTFDLAIGTLLTLDRGVRHDVEAIEDSAFLLTIAWPRHN
jgi:quercetin dioxygenase-like cupin family protein